MSHNSPNAHRPPKADLLSVRGCLRRVIGNVLPLRYGLLGSNFKFFCQRSKFKYFEVVGEGSFSAPSV
jgi:hypothetical protein